MVDSAQSSSAATSETDRSALNSENAVFSVAFGAVSSCCGAFSLCAHRRRIGGVVSFHNMGKKLLAVVGQFFVADTVYF